ncbi:YceI family protein [Palleronia caenipelagi]|uniref:YceI family protein n=1 Tax=Palleronia caenipelagi TaxID=2489174 RepID=A0A547PXZ5_9RHOB|nr:YceI family protein [Palleronia caenipelagi]TRD19030.1 YceI family protein [Palleronia caenipelagi]
MKLLLSAAVAAAALVGAAQAEPVKYELDQTHSEILFHWSHGGFSTTRGLFLGFDGEIMFDKDEPANSSVMITVPVADVLANGKLKEHLSSADFFGDNWASDVTFTSTAVEVTGENTANITGDLTLNGVTKPVVLDATLNKNAEGPRGNEVAGFSATTTVMRSEFNLGLFAPFVSDELQVEISVEASPAAS